MMDVTENVDVTLGELHEEKRVKKRGRKRKNVETDGEKLAGETNDSGREETTITEVGDDVQEAEPVLKSCPVGVDDNNNIASYNKGIDLNMTGDVAASCNVDDAKKSNKKKVRSKKKKAASAAAITENILETEGENMACQTQNKGVKQITGNKVIEGTELRNQNGAQEAVLPKSSPLGGDQDAIKNDVTEGNLQEEKKDNKTPKKHKRKALSEAVNPEQNLATKGENFVSQNQISKVGLTTGNQVVEETVMCRGAQDGGLLPKSSSVVAEDHIISKDGTIDQDVIENDDTMGNFHEAKRNDKECSDLLQVSEGSSLINENGRKEEKMVPATSGALLENSILSDKVPEARINEDTQSLQNQTTVHLGESIGKLEILLDTKKNDVCADHCVTASEVADLDVENPDTCKKKWEKRKRKSSSASQSNLNDKEGEKDRNMASNSVNDEESSHSRERNNVDPGEGLPLTGSISSSNSIKDVCGPAPVSNGEANHENILLPSPKRQCGRPPSRKLLILDINGLLADIVSPVPFGYKPDLMLSRKAVFKRPFCESFLKFCFEKFDVGVWSSRVKINVDNVLNFLMGEMKDKLVFYWDRSHCTITGFSTIENRDKPLVLKELRKLWDDHQFHLGKYDHNNTLLLDDSPYKALCNPADTAIFPLSYQYSDVNDCSLGPGGDLRVYLERLAMADSIPEFVRNNHFGQRPIRETNLSWNYYKKVIDSHKPHGKQ